MSRCSETPLQAGLSVSRLEPGGLEPRVMFLYAPVLLCASLAAFNTFLPHEICAGVFCWLVGFLVAYFGGATPSLLSRLGVLATDRRRELDYHHLHSNTGSMSADDNRSQGIELTPTKYPESTLDDRPPPSYDEVQDDPISPFKQLPRSASGKVSLEEIDKQIEKVFVSPARNSEDQ